jgi:SAM-dependent methyltransferase
MKKLASEKYKYQKIYSKNGVYSTVNGKGSWGESNINDYHWDKWGHQFDNHYFQDVIALKPKSILDVGCGHNEFCNKIRNRFITGDLIKRLVHKKCNKLTNDWLKSTGEDFPLVRFIESLPKDKPTDWYYEKFENYNPLDRKSGIINMPPLGEQPLGTERLNKQNSRQEYHYKHHIKNSLLECVKLEQLCVGVDFACHSADIIADAHEMPFENKEFDLITAFDVMEHIPEHEIEFVFNEFCRVGNRVFLEICLEQVSNRIDGEPIHVCLKSINWWKTIAEKYFDLERCELVGNAKFDNEVGELVYSFPGDRGRELILYGYCR